MRSQLKGRVAAIAMVGAVGLSFERACLPLEVSVSEHRGWLRRQPSARWVLRALLTDVICRVRTGSRQTHGSKRVHAELVLVWGIALCHNSVEPLDRQRWPRWALCRGVFVR